MPITCNYCNHYPNPPKREAEWVVALLCDKCEATGTMEICDHHYHKVYLNDNLRLACDKCHGTISYITERIDHSAQAEVIN